MSRAAQPGQPAEPHLTHPDGRHRPVRSWPCTARLRRLRGGCRSNDQRRGRLLPCPSACPWRRHLHAGMSTGRYAPSPSGRMHLGNLMCCLLAWLERQKARAGRCCCALRIWTPSAAPPCMRTPSWTIWRGWALPPTAPEPPVYQSDRSEIYQRPLRRIIPGPPRAGLPLFFAAVASFTPPVRPTAVTVRSSTPGPAAA